MAIAISSNPGVLLLLRGAVLRPLEWRGDLLAVNLVAIAGYLVSAGLYFCVLFGR